MFLAWVLFIMLAVSTDLVRGLGVNWGQMSSHPLPPTNVVKMLKVNGIKKVKLFDADPTTMKALAGTGLDVMVGIPNEKLDKLSHDYELAQKWVKENVTEYLHEGGVSISYVAVGNEPFLSSYNGSYVKTLFPSVKNIQRALDEAGVGQKIKCTVPFNADVYESPSNKPSDGRFRKDIMKQMMELLHFLRAKKAPFVVNIYPFLSLYQNSGFPQEFAFFDNGSPIRDKGAEYSNVFDANYDTLLWALKKVGVANLDIVIGEVGWPTDGNGYCNNRLAKKFYDGLLKKLASEEGTPLRKGYYLEVYLFGLFDEDQKSIAPGDFERHWGIFRYDGKPKFPMDLAGQKSGHQMLKGVEGVKYLERQWCVLNSDVRNLSTALVELNYACSQADCTSLGKQRSCDLELHDRISYAFNEYYQNKDQDIRSCNFNGMGTKVTQDPSTGDCIFRVQVALSAGERRHGLSYALSVFAPLFFIMSFSTLL